MEKSFESFRSVHAELDELFLLHREAVLVFRFDIAKALLAIFENWLVEHVRQEEEILLPLFETAGRQERWPRALFSKEHDKLLHLLGPIKSGLLDLEPSREGIRRRVLDLLEHETRFKHLSEHHHEREHQCLFPTLDRIATESQKETVIAGCQADWKRLTGADAQRLSDLIRELNTRA